MSYSADPRRMKVKKSGPWKLDTTPLEDRDPRFLTLAERKRVRRLRENRRLKKEVSAN